MRLLSFFAPFLFSSACEEKKNGMDCLHNFEDVGIEFKQRFLAEWHVQINEELSFDEFFIIELFLSFRMIMTIR